MKKFLFTLLPLMASVATGCSGNGDQPEGPVVCPEGVIVIEDPAAYGTLDDIDCGTVMSANGFAFRLFKAVQGASDDNVCLSPLSVSSVLAMLANGDDGATRDEVLSLLGYGDSADGLSELNNHYRILLSNLPGLDETATCKFTNTMWYDPVMMPVSRAFCDRIATSFYSVAIPRNPAGTKGMEMINEFVDVNTNGMIKRFIEEPLQEPMAFINTTYFKADWRVKFDKELTHPGSFQNIDGTVTETDFMVNTADFEYAVADDGTEAVRLPYGNGDFVMTAILPSEDINHIPLMECLDNDNWQKLNDSFREREVSVILPRFEHESKSTLTDILKDMGLDKACDRNYGFNSILEKGDPLVLSFFLHAAKIRVDEDGTEAAGVSMGGMNESVGEFIDFNRPFVYVIQEKKTGVILFIGSVEKF